MEDEFSKEKEGQFMFVKNGTGKLQRVLVSKPKFLEAAPINEIAKKWSRELNLNKMEEEHKNFVDAYRKNGVQVEFLDASKNRPNAVFSRDFGGCVQEGYVLGRFRETLREFEHVDYEKKMAELGIPCLGTCRKGCFEGGDFMFLNEKTIALGMMARTDEEGVREVSEILAPYGYEIIPVPARKEYLHLDMCFNLVGDHIAVAYVDGLPESFKKRLKEMEIELIDVPEEAIFSHGCNLQSLGENKVLSLRQNVKVNRELTRRNMNVVELDIQEILKAGGGPHCMSFPLARS